MSDEMLLKEVAAIVPQYDKGPCDRENNFNVFRLLQLESYEVRLHSVFLAELLNPKGTHGLGSILLDIFVKQLGIEFNTQNVEVNIEKYTGMINDDNTEGGRLDICISNHLRQGIVIENKIYAIDQQNQLLRYHRYAQEHFREFHLLYLTLQGNEPGDRSKGNNDDVLQCLCISYRHHVLTWLETCLEQTIKYPYLHATIVQYIRVLKDLTGQNIQKKMEEQIVNRLLSNDAYFKSAFAISGSMEQLKREIMDRHFIPGIKSVLSGYDLRFDAAFGAQKTGFTFKRQNWKYCAIYFQFHLPYGQFFYAVRYERPDEVPVNLIKQLHKLNFGLKEEPKWPWWRFVEGCEENELTAQQFLEIKNNTTNLYVVIKEAFETLHKMIEQSEKAVE